MSSWILKSVSVMVFTAWVSSGFANVEGTKEYLIKLKQPTTKGQLQGLLKGASFVRSEVLLVRLDSSQMAMLKQNRNVLHIEPNHTLKLFSEPNDLHSGLWGMKNTRSGFDINVVPAWSISTGSKDIVVAVIDTGIDLNHSDLKQNLWTNEAELNGQTGIDDDSNGYVDDVYGYDFASNSANPNDQQGHGTHVAGTIGAVGNNGSGVVGVNWNVSMMALKIFPRSGEATIADAIRSIDYAAENGARVINASWGESASSTEANEEYVLLKEAIERAEAKGVLFVAAAGNDGTNNDRRPMIPANLDVKSLVSVGSMAERGNRSGFSNYGVNEVDVFAPGSTILSTAIGGRTQYLSGTSMASPHVAGLAALALSVKPTLTPMELKDILIHGCKRNSTLETLCVCGGHIDALATLNLVSEL